MKLIWPSWSYLAAAIGHAAILVVALSVRTGPESAVIEAGRDLVMLRAMGGRH